jgi:hypothetical protein
MFSFSAVVSLTQFRALWMKYPNLDPLPAHNEALFTAFVLIFKGQQSISVTRFFINSVYACAYAFHFEHGYLFNQVNCKWEFTIFTLCKI